MFVDYQNKGLNGFWGDFWNSVKNAFGVGQSDSEQANNRSFGSLTGKWLRRAIAFASSGLLKTTDYVPTGVELLLFNRIKTALNNYVIQQINIIDAAPDKMFAMNNAVRRLQLIQNYVDSGYLNTSENFKIFLSEQIALMIETFQVSVEDILLGNGVDYLKVNAPLVSNSTDNYPNDLKPIATDEVFGFQYKVANDEPIDLNVPTTVDNNSTVTAIQTQPITATTTTVAGIETKTKNSSVFIAVGLFLTAVLVSVLIPNSKEKKAN